AQRGRQISAGCIEELLEKLEVAGWVSDFGHRDNERLLCRWRLRQDVGVLPRTLPTQTLYMVLLAGFRNLPLRDQRLGAIAGLALLAVLRRVAVDRCDHYILRLPCIAGTVSVPA